MTSLFDALNEAAVAAPKEELFTVVTDTDGFQVGDFLSSSWGYEQTNASFYKVIKRTPKFVTVVRVKTKKVTRDGKVLGLVPTNDIVYEHVNNPECSSLDRASWFQHQAFAASLDCFQPATLRRKLSEYGSISISSYAGAYPWDGKPQYDTRATGLPGH